MSLDVYANDEIFLVQMTGTPLDTLSVFGRPDFNGLAVAQAPDSLAHSSAQ